MDKILKKSAARLGFLEVISVKQPSAYIQLQAFLQLYIFNTITSQVYTQVKIPLLKQVLKTDQAFS